MYSTVLRSSQFTRAPPDGKLKLGSFDEFVRATGKLHGFTLQWALHYELDDMVKTIMKTTGIRGEFLYGISIIRCLVSTCNLFFLFPIKP